MRQQAKRLTEFQDSLEAEGYLRDYIHPILAGQPFTPEGQPDDDDFPIVCPNGCPGGSIGQHKFSCELARPAVSDETRFDLIRVHPYLWTRSEPRP